MKKILIFLLFCSFNLAAQDYVKLAQDTSLTFDEIVEQTELYFDQRGRGKHTGYKQWKRWEYWTRRSLGPSGKIISNARAFKEVSKYNKENNNVTRSAAGDWVEMGPLSATNSSTWSSHIGRISSIGLDVNDPDHIIVGSPSGGVWKTLDEGTTWTPIFDDEVVLNVYSLAISPTNDQHYLCGTIGLGVMQSTDGGTTWNTTAGISTNTFINRIAIDPSDANIVLAVNQWGNVYRSTDAGSNWTSILSSGNDIYDIEYKPGNTDIVYASSDGDVYKSTNNGASFSALSGPWGSNPMMMAVTADDADYLYVLETDQGGFGALYLSTDEGATFTTQSDDSANNNNIMGYNLNNKGGQAPRDMDVVVSPTDKSEVHVAGVMTFKSINSGQNWTQTTHWVISNPLPFIHADCDLMFYENGKIYFGTDGGIFISPDGGTTFDDKTTGLGVRQFYRIGVSETDVDRVSGGSQDNGTGTVESGAWTDWVGADGMETFIAKHNADIQYASIQFGSLYKTTNGGNSLASITNTSGSGDWVTPLEEDPIVNNTLYQGKAQLYKSTNGGSSWTTISNFNPANSNDVNLVEVTVAPTNNDVIYAAYRHQIFKTADGGTSWTDVSPSNSFSNVNYINVHPSDDQRALIVLSGTSQKVMESTDQGVTWSDITASLPSVGAECAIYEGGAEDGIYVSMNPGIYYKNNIATTWTAYNTLLPMVRVAELEIRNNFLYAATYGRGLWKNDLVENVACSISSITDFGESECDATNNNYARSLELEYTNSPGSGTLDVNGVSFTITGSPQIVTLLNQPLDGANVDVIASFSDDTACALTVPALYSNPTSCPCKVLDASEQIVSCEGNATATLTDDTFTFSIDPTGDNTGGTYSVSGDVSASNLPYGTVHIFDNNGAGFLITNGNLTLDIVDDGDPTCVLNGVIIIAPATCSENFICDDAFSIPSPGTYTALGPSQGNGGSNAGRQANWFTYVAPSDGLLTIHSCEMGVDTRLFLHDGTCAATNQLVTSDDDCAVSPGSADDFASEIVDYCVSSGTTYYIEWDDRWSQAGFDFEVAFTTNTYYADNDGDGYGDASATTLACSLPSGYVTDNTDCDDNDGNNYPGNTEVCDGSDNNCDGVTDEGVTITYYSDADGDGYGNGNMSTQACSAPSGYVTDNTDCDDNDDNNYPGNIEVCDGSDNNCDGIVDEGCGGSGDICDDIYLVISTLTQDINRAEINVTSDATVTSSNPVYFYAGTDIDLNPNFEVALGTEFNAIIQNCTPPPAPGGDANFYNINDLDQLEQYFHKENNKHKILTATLLDHNQKEVFSDSGKAELITKMRKYIAANKDEYYLLKLKFEE